MPQLLQGHINSVVTEPTAEKQLDVSLQDIQYKYDEFIADQETEYIHHYIGFGSLGTTLITISILIIVLTICSFRNKRKRPSISNVTNEFDFLPINMLHHPPQSMQDEQAWERVDP